MADPTWISSRRAALALGIPYATFPSVAVASGIRRRIIPGSAVRYHAGDVAALAARMVQGEGVAPPPTPAEYSEAEGKTPYEVRQEVASGEAALANVNGRPAIVKPARSKPGGQGSGRKATAR